MIKSSGLLLLTNPNPRGRFQSKDGLDCAGTRGGFSPDQTLEPEDALVLFHQDRTDHVVNRRGNLEKGSESKD